MKKYYAHSAREGTSIKHDLEGHLKSTAQLAQQFASSYDPEGLAYLAGLLHDIGKYYHEFQCYLDDPSYKRKHRDHSSAGAVYAQQHLSSETAFFLAILILSHHRGLISGLEWAKKVEEKKKERFVQEAIERAEDFLLKHQEKLKENRSPYFDPRSIDPVHVEMRIRMLFSALVDADFQDTEQHFLPEQTAMRGRHADLSELLQRLITYYERFKQIQNAQTSINRTRSHIFQTCLEKAEQEHPFYLLNVPTGLGKTLSSMAFALKHGVSTNKKRVIVALPFTSIIDQNAAVYQEVFGVDQVLEHHSQVDWKIKQESPLAERSKLAAENWDIPIVVTSTVQFFESLFAVRTSSVRKLHNIANSVVILDEFQMLPLELLEPIFATMEELMLTYNVTFVASSATPLSFKWKEYFHRVGQPRFLIEESESLFQQYQRVNFSWLKEAISWDELSDRGVGHRQALFIVNTRQDARMLFQALQQKAKADVYHLSTLMCSKHRQKVLEEVKRKLQQNQPVYLVSTQLIEAGVDIDFPVVYRALAPLDSIIQAAGRCNREGKQAKGKVIIFEPVEGGLPSTFYRTATAKTKILLQKKWDSLHIPQTYFDYFQDLYHLHPQQLDGKGIQRRRRKAQWDFPQMAKDFRMIAEDTVSVVCPYDQNGKTLIDFVCHAPPNRKWFRQVQPYVVELRRNDPVFREQAESFVAIAENWWVLKTNIYDSDFGLNTTQIYRANDLIL